MISDSIIKSQLAQTLDSTDFTFLGQKYQGKVRDNYTKGDVRYLITTDRLSCFDVVVTAVPFKGQVLTQLAHSWFEQTNDIVDNHIIDYPDPNVMVVKSCEVVPIEMVMRAYLTGGGWREYEKTNVVSGIKLPPNLRPSEKLPEVLLTPSTKAAIGEHDEPISEAEILKRGIVSSQLWAQMKEAAFGLFRYGQAQADKRGLILVDTKYEFGLSHGKLLLVDEIHTLDSSRYWVKETYKQKFEKGEAPEMLDKEPTRQWLLSQGYQGNGPIPTFTDEHRIQISKHYINAFEKISGQPFKAEGGDVKARIEAKLKKVS